MTVLVNWGIHLLLEGVGAGSLWCILRGCTNTSHKHGVKYQKGLAILMSALIALVIVLVAG